ncbi:MAG: hypothetical protein P4L56_04180 [Candidatus Sulfopaludibacter sp.]|nr:hypothetical protein [Candidatus Sulfopaludibacter sp.]
MTKLRGFGLFLLLASGAWGADVTGKWTGSLDLNTGTHGGACVLLKQQGGTITGTQGPSEAKQFALTSGRIDGGQVTIEARPGATVLRLTMKLEGNKLSGDVFEDDQKIGTVSLQKVDK